MWGSDQASSVEPGGLEKLVKYIRVTEQSLGDGCKRVYQSELNARKRLRRTQTAGESKPRIPASAYAAPVHGVGNLSADN